MSGETGEEKPTPRSWTSASSNAARTRPTVERNASTTLGLGSPLTRHSFTVGNGFVPSTSAPASQPPVRLGFHGFSERPRARAFAIAPGSGPSR